MKILLIGEYSHLHYNLKKGLLDLGHEVVLIGNSNGFKSYIVDYDFEAKIAKSLFFYLPRKIISRLFKFDIATLEYGLRFYLKLPLLKKYDFVQFINEAPIKTTKKLELFLIKKIKEQNKKCFILSSGIDYMTLKFYVENENYKSIYKAMLDYPTKPREFDWFFLYFKNNQMKIHNYMKDNFDGLIATDFDYIDATKTYPHYVAYIPYPIDINVNKYKELVINDRIVIFLGINSLSYYQKGIPYFEAALKEIEKLYEDKVEIIIAKNTPYKEYLLMYEKTHILLDQAYCNDQGYNALEAMAKGKVVFTGAETEFLNEYNLQEDEICINAKPDVEYLVNKLSFLIENPNKILEISKRGRMYVEKEHNYKVIAKKYLDCWGNAKRLSK
jgi:glycosyltransferase involved in cell wall biosynthesis